MGQNVYAIVMPCSNVYFLVDIVQQHAGRTAPIPINQKQSSLGIGKQEVDTWYGEISTSKRKTLEAEKQAEETEDQRNKREVKKITGSGQNYLSCQKASVFYPSER